MANCKTCVRLLRRIRNALANDTRGCARITASVCAFIAVLCTFIASIIWSGLSARCARGDCETSTGAHVATCVLYYMGVFAGIASVFLFGECVQPNLDEDDWLAVFKSMVRNFPVEPRRRQLVCDLLLRELQQGRAGIGHISPC